jgi:hypothetical protein
VTDSRSLSRRKLLWALTTVGAAASTGGGAAALFHDSETFGESTVSAGVVDLDAEPSWGNDDSLGTISTGESGSREVRLTLVDNPSYVWFRTACKQCVAAEEALYVRYGVDTTGDGEIDTPITDGYVTLREARERFGTGHFIGTLDPDTEWLLVAKWELREWIEDTDVSLSFDFYATQTRHIPDPDGVALPWSCVDCGDPTGDPSNGDGSVSAISWVAFCGDSSFEGNFTPERDDGERTLLLDTAAYTVLDSVNKIAIKYGQTIEVFTYDGQDSLTVGVDEGTTYRRVQGDTYENTDRSSSNFCAGDAGCKYEFPDETGDGGWECTAGQDDTTENGSGSGNGNGNGSGNGNGNQPAIRPGASDGRLGGER